MPVRILWAVNVPLPAASDALGLPCTPFGGWLSTMTRGLAQVPGVRLGVAMRAPVGELRMADVDGIRYYALPESGRGGLDARDGDCARVLADFQPDLLHAEGSEMAYTRRLLQAWQGPRLLSLQGVINGIEPHYLGGLAFGPMLAAGRWRQVLAMAGMVANKRLRFVPRLRGERDTLALAGHVMGRTPWDRAQAWALNPSAHYHHCARTLRPAFSSRRWSVDACERHAIFLGNSAVALKGVHVALDALVLLRRQFPAARLVIAGPRPDDSRGLRRILGYQAYLLDRIAQLGLQAAVEFTGPLDADAMAGRMSGCHAYAMASLIENSPNTLGEAMLLGMPCVSGHAGGAPGMARDEEEALFFRAGDAVGLAWRLQRIFASDELAVDLGRAAHARATATHDPERNLRDLLTAYRTILGREVGP